MHKYLQIQDHLVHHLYYLEYLNQDLQHHHHLLPPSRVLHLQLLLGFLEMELVLMSLLLYYQFLQQWLVHYLLHHQNHQEYQHRRGEFHLDHYIHHHLLPLLKLWMRILIDFHFYQHLRLEHFLLLRHQQLLNMDLLLILEILDFMRQINLLIL